MAEPLVSVIIPLLLPPRPYLAEALESIRAQTYPNIETLLVVEGDDESEWAALKKLTGEGVRLLRQTQTGAGAGRNLGVAEARGEYVAMLDDDDLCTPNRIADQVAAVQADPQPSLCFGHVVEFGLATRNPQPQPGLISGALLTRRQTYIDLGGFDQVHFAGEMIQLLAIARDRGLAIHVLPQVILRRRIHEGHRTMDRGRYQQYVGAVRDLLQRRRAEKEAGP